MCCWLLRVSALSKIDSLKCNHCSLPPPFPSRSADVLLSRESYEAPDAQRDDEHVAGCNGAMFCRSLLILQAIIFVGHSQKCFFLVQKVSHSLLLNQVVRLLAYAAVGSQGFTPWLLVPIELLQVSDDHNFMTLLFTQKQGIKHTNALSLSHRVLPWQFSGAPPASPARDWHPGGSEPRCRCVE